ncbi:MAG: hypothetical protein ACO1OF_03445 [Adhaeribacter sp.]
MNETVKVSSFGEKDKALFIDGEIIRFQNKEIRQENITGIRYWISAIEIYEFIIGRNYYIGLKTPDEQLDINFKSYFGFSNSYFSKICKQVIDKIWEPAYERIWNRETDKLIAGDVIKFGHCQLSNKGVLILKENLLSRKEQEISWMDLSYEKKYDRLVLNSTSNPNIWTNIYYKDSWNIEILMALLDWITKENGLEEMQQ